MEQRPLTVKSLTLKKLNTWNFHRSFIIALGPNQCKGFLRGNGKFFVFFPFSNFFYGKELCQAKRPCRLNLAGRDAITINFFAAFGRQRALCLRPQKHLRDCVNLIFRAPEGPYLGCVVAASPSGPAAYRRDMVLQLIELTQTAVYVAGLY